MTIQKVHTKHIWFYENFFVRTLLLITWIVDQFVTYCWLLPIRNISNVLALTIEKAGIIVVCYLDPTSHKYTSIVFERLYLVETIIIILQLFSMYPKLRYLLHTDTITNTKRSVISQALSNRVTNGQDARSFPRSLMTYTCARSIVAHVTAKWLYALNRIARTDAHTHVKQLYKSVR